MWLDLRIIDAVVGNWIFLSFFQESTGPLQTGLKHFREFLIFLISTLIMLGVVGVDRSVVGVRIVNALNPTTLVQLIVKTGGLLLLL